MYTRTGSKYYVQPDRANKKGKSHTLGEVGDIFPNKEMNGLMGKKKKKTGGRLSFWSMAEREKRYSVGLIGPHPQIMFIPPQGRGRARPARYRAGAVHIAWLNELNTFTRRDKNNKPKGKGVDSRGKGEISYIT